MQAIDVTYQWSLMELTEDQYYASKDENMDKLPNFKKFIAYYTLRACLVECNRRCNVIVIPMV